MCEEKKYMDEEQEYKDKELTRINNFSNEELFNELIYMVDGMDFYGDQPSYVVSVPYPNWLYSKLKIELKIRLGIGE